MAFTTCSYKFHNFFQTLQLRVSNQPSQNATICTQVWRKKKVIIPFFKLLTVIQISIVISSSCPFFQAQESSRKYSSYPCLWSSSLPFCSTSTPFTWWGNQNHKQDTRWRNSGGEITFPPPFSVPFLIIWLLNAVKHRANIFKPTAVLTGNSKPITRACITPA